MRLIDSNLYNVKTEHKNSQDDLMARECSGTTFYSNKSVVPIFIYWFYPDLVYDVVINFQEYFRRLSRRSKLDRLRSLKIIFYLRSLLGVEQIFVFLMNSRRVLSSWFSLVLIPQEVLF